MSLWTTRAHELQAAQARLVAEIAQELDPNNPATLTETKHIASPAGSEQALRGIPVVGARGVGGTITGTNPLTALLTAERHRARIAA